MDPNERIFLDDMREAMEKTDRDFWDDILTNEEDLPDEEEPMAEVIFDDDLTREECEELMAKMDEFEKRAREKMISEIKVYTCDKHTQEFLLSLIPKRR